MPLKRKLIVLIILDGWGIAPEAPGNALSQAQIPHLKKYIASYPAAKLTVPGLDSSSSETEPTSCALGHLTIGSGRNIMSVRQRINEAISDGSFLNNPVFLQGIKHCQQFSSKMHLCTVVSHSFRQAQLDHLYALLALLKNAKVKKIFLHLILDGVDASENAGLVIIKELLNKISELKLDARIATISGRYFGLDRNNFWDRTKQIYTAMTFGQSAENFSDPLVALETSYEHEVFDQHFMPVAIYDSKNKPVATINDNDALFFLNYKVDGILQLVKAFALPDFIKFEALRFSNLFIGTICDYDSTLAIDGVAFPEIAITNSLTAVLAKAGLKQLYLAETEKFPQATYYLSGKLKQELDNCQWQNIPSELVDGAYEPEMAAGEITAELEKAINSKEYDFIAVNYTNLDTIAHSGKLNNTVAAAEICDKYLNKIIPLVLIKNGLVILTADHGNAEQMQDIQTGELSDSHTANPVPLVVISPEYEGKNIGWPDVLNADLSLVKSSGTLSDIAPTILKLYGLRKPKEMTGESLL